MARCSLKSRFFFKRSKARARRSVSGVTVSMLNGHHVLDDDPLV
jgi:hypothetical protein